MALSRQQSVFTYSSASGGETYLFDILVDGQGGMSARNIRSPRGLIADAYTTVPDSVLDDIAEAKDLVSQMLDETEVDNGTVVFTGETSQAVVIAGGVLNNTNYRVAYTTPDGTVLTTTNKTTTGFSVVAPVAYGSVLDPKTVAYVVLVSTQQASVTGGTLTFVVGDAGQKTVTFAAAFASADYRVILSENGFFKARVINQTRNGFTVQLGYTLGAVETVTVGYDVFV